MSVKCEPGHLTNARQMNGAGMRRNAPDARGTLIAVHPMCTGRKL
jgi:hypothetical protein